MHLGDQLSNEQWYEMEKLLSEFADVFQERPGRTNLVEHSIPIGSARLLDSPLPIATCTSVDNERRN